ncbi:MAG: cytochrome-c peroxidase, partial [Nitrosomonas sp.]|nr:cytochrome-c peroxidase [Nitrosomonas sp.]
SLTDERVRYERAPFDHPELLVSHGHAGDNLAILAESSLSTVLAADEILVIPAVGAEGSTEPLQPFEFYLE